MTRRYTLERTDFIGCQNTSYMDVDDVEQGNEFFGLVDDCRHETKVHELVIIREGGYERCVAYIDCEDLFRLPPDIAHADVIDSSRDHIKVLDHQDAYVIVPCTCLDIK